jgi:hypothetical protein
LRTGLFRVNEPKIIHQLLDDEVVAINMESGDYHALPGVAGDVLMLAGAAGATAEEIAGELSKKYEVAFDVLSADLDAYLEELLERSILTKVQGRLDVFPAPSLHYEGTRLPYKRPALESYGDLQDLILLDPIHDVGERGWPNLPTQAKLEDEADTLEFLSMRCKLASPSIIFERFETETVVMNLASGTYHSLTGPAEDIFLLLQQEPTAWEMRNALATKYDAEMEELEGALRRYLDELAQEGLIVRELAEAHAPERALEIGATEVLVPFTWPAMDTQAQPSFDSAPVPLTQAVMLQDVAGEITVRNPFERCRYAIRPDGLVWSTVDGEIVLADRERGRYYELNVSAAYVFSMLVKGATAVEIVRMLQARYEAPEQTLRAALIVLLHNLRKMELVTEEESPEAAVEPGESFSAAEDRTAFEAFYVVAHHELKDLLLPFHFWTARKVTPKVAQTRQFLAMLDDYFEEASAACGSSDAVYAVGRQSVRICCAGEPISELQRAFQHLQTEQTGSTAALTIRAWSRSAASAGPLLDLALRQVYDAWTEICGPRGEMLDFHGGPIAAIFHPGPDTISLLDKETGKAYFLDRGMAPLPFWELSSPFRHILHPWFAAQGMQYTHGGAVGTANCGVLLAGKGGVGKSTTSMLCAAAGMLYAADDYCLTDGRTGEVFSLYNTAKLKGPEDLERFPALKDKSYNRDSFEHGGLGKATYCLAEIWPERMAKHMTLRAIVLPQLGSATDSRLERCSPADALLALCRAPWRSCRWRTARIAIAWLPWPSNCRPTVSTSVPIRNKFQRCCAN